MIRKIQTEIEVDYCDYCDTELCEYCGKYTAETCGCNDYDPYYRYQGEFCCKRMELEDRIEALIKQLAYLRKDVKIEERRMGNAQIRLDVLQTKDIPNKLKEIEVAKKELEELGQT